MHTFIALFENIDQTQSTNEKVQFIRDYFSNCSDEEGAWALFFLSGQRIKRLISSRMLLMWCMELIDLPPWLVEESYAAVGDTAETIALLLPHKTEKNDDHSSLSEWMEMNILPLNNLDLEQRKIRILSFWNTLNSKEIFIVNKIITGAFRIGVSKLLTIKALSLSTGLSKELLSQRLMGNWQPTADFFRQLKAESDNNKYLNPYPFYLAHPFEGDMLQLGEPSEWLIEWKWDGIRAQVVIREDGIAIWSRGNELITDQFPELVTLFQKMPTGMVLDGEIIAYADKRPLPFGTLQRRLGRKKVSLQMQRDVPVAFVVYDLLELNSEDIRNKTMEERRLLLENITLPHENIFISERVIGDSWTMIEDLRKESRDRATEGLMLKKIDSKYGVGRQKGFWWKYKIDPMSIDAVLIYAQSGSGRRANLFTDYTFAVWHDDTLVPIAKAYSGLNQNEINELDRWIRKNTEEKFGPVRKVKAAQVFEIGFEAIQTSKRHKSGVALRFPRILRWRKDKPISECDTLASIKLAFLHEHS